MSEARRTVFISCGQYTEEERDLGRRVCNVVAECTPFQGYFAENQTTLKALSENVLARLYDSVGLIAIMHHRGTVETPDGSLVRGSVWIEQEIAIAALMEQILRRPLHVAFFLQRGIGLEGIRQQLQLNPFVFTIADEVIDRLRELLPSWTAPLYKSEDELQARVNSVDLSIVVDNGSNSYITIQVDNHSDVHVDVKSIVLWSRDSRLCKPVSPPEGVLWSVPARRCIPIRFDTRELLALRLMNIYGEPLPIRDMRRTFRAEIRTELRCEILGFRKTFEETSTVQVDVSNHQILAL
jgi:hypothetical protein